ncbi:hypothetical protein J6R97_02655 [bacterium]|nr:hypothetical protein [bacterium]
MKRFKKRTIALVLASVVTVVGAFASSNYKNSLMELTFDGSSGENVNLLVQTRMAYSGNVTPVKKDANTYVLMLPEMDSKVSTPDISKVSSCISSVNIRTMPYSNSAKGYTRIVIKTINPTMTINAQNQVFIGTIKESVQSQPQNKEYKHKETVPKRQEVSSITNIPTKKYYDTTENIPNPQLTDTINNSVNNQISVSNSTEINDSNTDDEIDFFDKKENTNNFDANNIYLFLWAILIVLISAFLYVKAKNKMHEIAGEKLDISVEDDEQSKPKEKIKKIKKTINTLDATYSKTALKTVTNNYQITNSSTPTAPVETLEIIDLDKLFQEKHEKTKEQEENEALEEFLSGFSFNDESELHEEEKIEENKILNNQLYDSILENHGLQFTQEDLISINQLLDLEITDEVRNNPEAYLISNPIKKELSKDKILENIITDYAISQNIIFTQEDVNILYKLISFEIDKDFITDLRTNPDRTKEMEKSIIENSTQPQKLSKLLTLNVSNMLPDLSATLENQKGKEIKYERKHEVVYFSEGYDFETLSINDQLPDLNAEDNTYGYYGYDNTPIYEIVDGDFVLGENKIIATNLPDLNDVLANPKKYQEPEPEKPVVNEEALLNNLTNVTFKPFDDGTNKFEILNEVSDQHDIEEFLQIFSEEYYYPDLEQNNEKIENDFSDSYEYNDSQVYEIIDEKKFTAIDNKIVVDSNLPDLKDALANPEKYQNSEPEEVVADEEALLNNLTNVTFKPFDDGINKFKILNDVKKIEQKPVREVAPTPRKPVEQKPVREVAPTPRKPVEQKPVREVAPTPRKPVEQKPVREVVPTPKVATETNIIKTTKCIVEGTTYDIVDVAQISNNQGVYLAKNSKNYAILGYIGEKIFVIRQYDTVKYEKIYVKLSEKLTNECSVHIVRVGQNKFIIKVKDDSLEFVMDL